MTCDVLFLQKFSLNFCTESNTESVLIKKLTKTDQATDTYELQLENHDIKKENFELIGSASAKTRRGRPKRLKSEYGNCYHNLYNF